MMAEATGDAARILQSLHDASNEKGAAPILATRVATVMHVKWEGSAESISSATRTGPTPQLFSPSFFKGLRAFSLSSLHPSVADRQRG